MGVNGLWQVLQPCARPTNLATLNRKRLAVDASIWIYQFLKAVRDKEGNALRNSHVVGFFRRICKLLWFGIRPVFVFDGGAPALKRATLQGRRRRREGRREDAARTAGKLLAVQMQRLAEEHHQGENRRRRRQGDGVTEAGIPSDGDGVVAGETIPGAEQIVYADEALLSRQERQKSRRFHKQDAYHLPAMETGIENMGKPEDPRIMSVEELEEYARQFHNGEDVNLYDFSKIDFNGEFFKSLPPPDRYNILNAARLRSRLRMGLSKEQLDEMFPDRMAFSRFQIERVKERNHLTQRLMYEVGMVGTDWTVGVNARIAGEKNREYFLVKNEGAEGGWALGVVSKEKDRGEIHKPIDVDALQFQYQAKKEDDEWEDDEDFEDVPIEGLNRLPKISHMQNRKPENDDDDAMFVDGNEEAEELFGAGALDDVLADEEEDIDRAIAMSLQSQHGIGPATDEHEEFDDVAAPEWTQKAVEAPRPIASTSGKMIAHMVNNRANAAVPKRRGSNASNDSSDDDFRAALAAARKKKASQQPVPQARPVRPNVKNPFDGPLPFEKLDWGRSIFGKKPGDERERANERSELEPPSDEEEMAGGFEVAADDGPRPLPPWMIDDTDIRESIAQQQAIDHANNARERQIAEEEEQQQQRERRDDIVEIESSDEGDGDIEIVEAPPPRDKGPETVGSSFSIPVHGLTPSPEDLDKAAEAGGGLDAGEALDPQTSAAELAEGQPVTRDIEPSRESSPEVEFEDVELPDQAPETERPIPDRPSEATPDAVDVSGEEALHLSTRQETAGDDALFSDGDFDDFSDAEDEELLAQMAEEAEEHARFASTLNNKSERENQEAYERELKALRNQQKKDRRDADEVTQIMVTECQSLLRLFGIPYVTAPMEAEAQCAKLVSLGLVDGIVTDDSDTFLFGGTRVYKNMFNSNKLVECYVGSDLEKELSLSRDQLISIAQLLGSDYTEGLAGVGPVTALEILSEFPGAGGLDEFREWWQDVQAQSRPKEADAGSTFRKKFRKAQGTKLFLPTGFPNPAVPEAYLKPVVDGSEEQFQWGVPDLDGLRQFLMATIGWSQERTDEVLVPVIKDMNRRETEGTQSNITRFFTGSVGAGAKEASAPRQRAKGSKRMAAAVDRLRAKTGAIGLGEEDGLQTAAAGRKRKARNATGAEDDFVADEEGSDLEAEADMPARSTAKKGQGKKAKAKA